MHRFVVRAICTAFLVAAPEMADVASAQSDQVLKARCAQLIRYFDYYGQSRGEHSDGARNMSRVGAGIDCDRGDYHQGIAMMETLLRNKNMGIPAPQ